MIFSYNWLQNYIEGRLPKPDRLVEILTMHSFEVEKLEKRGKDWLLDIDILPNRAYDCLSHWGLAREISAVIGLKLKNLDTKLKEDKKIKAENFAVIEVRNKNDCPRYTARVIADVKVGPSPKLIREKLKICNINSINNIVDIVNYVMLETGQPLHAFDFEKIESVNSKSQILKKIIVRRAKNGEKIISLDKKKYDLDEEVLVITDSGGPLAIAGIKGGERAEIDRKTKTIVLESANFNSRVIRKCSKKLALKTDASWRFENGIDPNLTEIAINRAAQLIKEIAGGKISSGLLDFYPKKVQPKKIKLNLDYLERLLGLKIPRKEIERILTRLNFKIEKPYSKSKKLSHKINSSSTSMLRSMEVTAPTFRGDISIQEDLIEEVGRIYGYDKIKPNFPVAALVPPKKNFEIFWENITKNILKEAGFSETYNYSFIGSKEIDFFGYDKDVIELENPISSEFRYLRPSLIPGLIKNLQANFRYFDRIKIFELGKVFSNIKNQESKVVERRMLSGLIANKKNDKELFYSLKGAIDSLINGLGISDIYYDDYQVELENDNVRIWQSNKVAEIKIDGERIGFLGEVSDKILSKMKINGKAVIFDIDFEKLQKLCSEEHEYRPISAHPAAVRDIAILVPLDIKVADVLNKINVAGGPLVRDVDLFDIYQGEELPEGKKNLAFHIIYQAEDRTLTSEEINAVHKKIIEFLEEDPEWEVRK